MVRTGRWRYKMLPSGSASPTVLVLVDGVRAAATLPFEVAAEGVAPAARPRAAITRAAIPGTGRAAHGAAIITMTPPRDAHRAAAAAVAAVPSMVPLPSLFSSCWRTDGLEGKCN